MLVPDKVVDENENCGAIIWSAHELRRFGSRRAPTARSDEQRVRQRDEGEPPHVTQVDNMGDDPKQC